MRSILLARLLSGCVAVTILPALASAADEPALKEILARPILDASVPQSEVEKFCDARVPRMPQVKTAAEWEAIATKLRADVLEKMVFRGEAVKWRDAQTKVEWQETIEGGEGYKIKKLRYEALPGLWIPALLYEPTKLEGKVPVFLNVNGHDGVGKAAGYKQIRCINQAKRGIISLNVEWLGMGQLRSPGFTHYKMNQLDLCGTSGIAPFYLAMKRGLDVLLAHANADPTRVGVAGLSGGGWQTIFISSLDTRVTLANPVAGYSSFRTRIANYSDLGDSEQTPCDLARYADYAHLTAMMAPRGLLLTYNAKDNCCFAAPHALPPLLEAARPIYKLTGAEERLHEHINYDPGNHNFERDNREAHYRVVGAQFFSGDVKYSPSEIDSAAEVKKAEELSVELPEDNLDFQRIAEKLIAGRQSLPAVPADEAGAKTFQNELRVRLKETVMWHGYGVTAEESDEQKVGATTHRSLKFRISDDWTVPGIVLERGEAKQTALVIADGGRASAADAIEELLAKGSRVVAIDPFYFGDSKIKNKDFLFALLVSAVGERPLGIQASQVAAVARHLQDQYKQSPVTLVAIGPRTSLIALVAAAVEGRSIATVQLHGSYGSLKEVIEQQGAVNATPELFCFGLLDGCDIPALAAAVAPRQLTFVAPSDRVKQELQPLAAWYKVLGKEFDPLQSN